MAALTVGAESARLFDISGPAVLDAPAGPAKPERLRSRSDMDKRTHAPEESPATSAPLGSARYWTEHDKMRRLHGKASNYLCEGCCGRQARQWATIHGRTGLEPMVDRAPLCVSCHVEYDQGGRRGPRSEATRRKMSDGMRDKNRRLRQAGLEPMPPETRAKLSAALKGRPKTAEQRAKIAATLIGHDVSPEARQRMSDAVRRRIEEARARGVSPLSGRAAENAAKTHCDNNHKFTPENTYYDKRGNRSCRECRRARSYAWYLKNKKGA